MKKTLLIASALLIAGSMYAETDMYLGDVKMEAGKTYTFNEIEGDDAFGYEIKPPIFAMSDKDTSFSFSYKSISGEMFEFCGAGGVCFPPAVEGSYNGNLIAGQKWDAQLHYSNYEAQSIEELPKDITLELKLDAKSYTLVMNSSEGSVSVIEKDRNVAFSNNALVYSLSNAAEAVVYDMQGRKVMSTTVNGSGSLNLGTLSRGAYIYRIGNTAGKIMVK